MGFGGVDVVVVVVVDVDGDFGVLTGRLGSFLSPWIGTRRKAVTLSGRDRVFVGVRELVVGLVERRGESAGVSARDELFSKGY